MRIGDTVKITACDSMPEVVGASAEIVELQMQQYEKYRAYPVWAKVTSGQRAGKVYGFRDGEVELLPMEEIGGTIMGIGDTVEVMRCDSMPEVVGARGEIVDIEIQEFAKHTVYPIWVKITSGERAGKVYGFREGELERVLAGIEAQEPIPTTGGAAAKTKVIEQLEEILKGVVTVEEIAEVERVIAEAKGKIVVEPSVGFWEGKTPCWEMFRCPEAMRNECPAFKYQSLPCWEIEGTYCKLYDYGAKGDGTDICQYCRVYKRWGHGQPIQIKLFGKGFSPVA